MNGRDETMRPLDIQTLPVDGTVCIEASAGTGKTFTIGLIVLRLVMERDLEVAKLAVVTFTEAAAGELAERIADFLRIARDYSTDHQRREPKHSVIYDLVDAAIEIEGEKVAVRLNGALLNYDLAQIVTIHGFCLRLLNDFAFETGSAYGVEFIQDQDALITEVLSDFWRREIAVLSAETFKLLDDFTPGALIGFYRSFLNHPNLIVRGPEMNSRTIEQFAAAYGAIHQQWLQSRPLLERILTEDEKRFKQTSLKIDRIPEYLDEIDSLFADGKMKREKMQKFSRTTLEANLKNGIGFTIPAIPYIDAIEQFLDTYESLPSQITAHFLFRGFNYLRKELITRKKELRIRTFDNMISDLSQSLTGGNGASAVEAIRKRFSAVLVDEFQDTDALQYAIFNTLFATYPEVFFAMIGDPKQAIYGFRGGDIHTYVRAKNSVDPEKRFTLMNNFRSERRLIDAVNRIYAVESPDLGGNGPFLTKSISYVPVNAMQDLLPPKQGERTLSPVTVWKVADDERPDEYEVARTVARTIVSFSEPSQLLMIGSEKKRRPVRLGDIAVLVNKNDSAATFKKILAKYGIRSVIAKSGPVTESDEAETTLLLMQAMMDPSKERLVRALLISDLFNYDLDALTRWEVSDEERLTTLNDLSEGRRRWTERGIAAALNYLFARTGTLTMSDDKDLAQERRITNFRHLMEILHTEELRVGRIPERLLNAFVQMRSGNETSSGGETQEQRLESDYDAVQILTMHRSKGLQWPIVFAVDLWIDGIMKRKEPPPIYVENEKRIADLDPERFDEIKTRITAELRQERMRLAYVAVTRAESLLYVVSANQPQTEKKVQVAPDMSPAALLFRSQELSAMADPIGPLVTIVDLVPDDTPFRLHYSSSITTDRELNLWDEHRKLLPAWTIGSYSGLTKVDQDRHRIEPVKEQTEEALPEGIFAFPKGAEAGTVLHTILERVDYIDASDIGANVPEEILKTVNGVLADAGFINSSDLTNTGVVLAMLKNVMTAEIPHVSKGFRLGVLRDSERLNELEFHLSAAHPEDGRTPVSAAELMQVIGPELGSVSEKRRLNGFLTGVIDLVFRYQGRWWIVDWKSNHLGNSSAKYDRESLEQSMREHNYHLQYHLYTVALVRYLTASSGGMFDYDRDFGGVLYVFLRGVDENGNGIYYTRPSAEVIYGLEGKL